MDYGRFTTGAGIETQECDARVLWVEYVADVGEGSMWHAGSILAPPRLTTHIYGVWLPLAGIVATIIPSTLVCYATTWYRSGLASH